MSGCEHLSVIYPLALHVFAIICSFVDFVIGIQNGKNVEPERTPFNGSTLLFAPLLFMLIFLLLLLLHMNVSDQNWTIFF